MKHVYALLALLLFAFPGLADEQRSFAEKGLDSFTVEGVEERSCISVPFAGSEVDGGSFPMLSIKAVFSPVREGSAGVVVSLNGQPVQNVPQEDFFCSDTGCWARVLLPRENLQESNTLRLCPYTGRVVNSIALSNSSLLGAYELAVIEQDSFVKSVESPFFEAGEDVQVTLSITNTGTRAVDIEMKYIRESVHIPEVKKLIGASAYMGPLEPGETRELTYTLRVESETPLALPPGVLRYENIFGEQQELLSNPVSLSVAPEEIGVEAVVVQPAASGPGLEMPLSLVVHNRSRGEWQDLSVVLVITGESMPPVRLEQALPLLLEGGSETLSFSFTPTTTGSFSASCNVFAPAKPEPIGACAPTPITVRDDAAQTILLGGMVLAVLAVLVYVYIQTR